MMILLMQDSGFWWHYLSLVPNNDECGPPMLWAESERHRLLQGTGLERKIDADLERIKEDFTELALPFMQKYPQYFRCVALLSMCEQCAFLMCTVHQCSAYPTT